MRIIVVTPAVPHPFGDTAARWFYVLITELAARGHEVVALVATEEPQERVAEAKQWLAKQDGKLTLHCHRLKVDSAMLRRKWQNLMRPRSEILQDSEFTAQLQRELTRGYDILHLEQMSTGWLGLNVPRALLNVHYFDVIDWAERQNMGLGDRKALWQARRATKYLLHGIGNVRLLTPRLKEMAESIHPGGHYWIVPLALDPALYAMSPLVEEPTVGLIGSMHWEPSRSAAERLITRIWPLVKQRVSEAKLFVAGWNASEYLQEYSSQPGLTLADNLKHPSEFFSQAAVMVYAPSRGSGMKVKVMESMAYGVPVVTTWEGVEGIDYQNGRECWVAETDEELAGKVCRLLENSVERQQMRAAARTLIEERYSPGPVVDKMISVYQQLVTSCKASSHVSLCI
ncbi:MAG: glycosyltransferase family 4 protein [Candidatus Korobacteraceae bacterium]